MVKNEGKCKDNKGQKEYLRVNERNTWLSGPCLKAATETTERHWSPFGLGLTLDPSHSELPPPPPSLDPEGREAPLSKRCDWPGKLSLARDKRQQGALSILPACGCQYEPSGFVPRHLH